MHALAIVYERDAGPGVFEQEAEANGTRLDWWIATEEETPPQEPEGYDAVIVLGSSTHADQEEANAWLRGQKRLVADLLNHEIPLIGVCLGSQLVAEVAGAPPRPLERPEIGWVEVELTAAGRDDPLTGTLPQQLPRLRVAQLRCTPSRRRGGAGPEQRLPPGIPFRRIRLGRSSSTPR